MTDNYLIALRAALARAQADRKNLIERGAPTDWVDLLIQRHEQDLKDAEAPSEEANGHGMFPNWDTLDILLGLAAVIGTCVILWRWLA